MFAYCGNNPILSSDPNGYRPIWERYYSNGLFEYTDANTSGSNHVTVIYNSDEKWEKAANKTGRDFCNAVGANYYCTVPARTTKFKDSWGKISASYLLIETHGTPSALSTKEFFYVTIDDILSLPQNENIKCVIITACSTGGNNHGNMNIAQAISTKIAPDGIVFCATTTVLGNGEEYTAEYGGKWVIYQNGAIISNGFSVVITMNFIADVFYN